MIATLAVAAVMFCVIGAASARLFRIPVPSSIDARLATYFLLGLGINGSLSFIIGRAMSIVAALSLAVLLLTWRRQVVIATKPMRVATLLAIAPFIIVLGIAMTVPLADFDGRTTWLPKAVAIATEHSIRGPFFQGQNTLNLHNHYPLLLPIDVATLMTVMRGTDTDRVRPVFVLIPLALVLATREVLGWLIVVIAWLPPLFTAHEGGALSAYSDLSIAAFAGLAVISVANGRRGASLWLAFLVLTKNEGLLLAAAIVIASWRWRLAILPTTAAVILAWWRASVPDAYDERYGVLLRDFPHQLHRFPTAAAALLSHATAFRVWGVFWVAVMLAIITMAVRRKALFAPAVIVLVLFGYAAIFTVTSWNIADLANVTADRLLLHIIVPAAFVVRHAWDAVG